MNRGPCTMDHGPRSSLQGQPCSLQIFLLKGRSAEGRSLYNNDHASRPSQAASAQETMDMSAPLAHGPLSLNNGVHGPWSMGRAIMIEVTRRVHAFFSKRVGMPKHFPATNHRMQTSACTRMQTPACSSTLAIISFWLQAVIMAARRCSVTGSMIL